MTDNCKLCHLHMTRNKIVYGEGPVPCDVMVVGEAPGREEDQQGRPFVGSSGKMLRQMLRQAGITSYYITNIVKCRPPGNRTPTAEEVEACKPHLLQELELVQPKYIIAVGEVATLALCHNKLSHVAGSMIKSHDFVVLSVYHPAYILRGQPELYPVNVWWMRKIVKPPTDYPTRYLVNSYEALDLFTKWVNQQAPVALDIETTGFDPFTDDVLGFAVSGEPGVACHFSGEFMLNNLHTLQQLLSKCRAVFHNNLFDRRFLARKWNTHTKLHGDTLLGIHLVHPDLPKSLDFVRTLYTSVPPYKYVYKSRETGVSHLDAHQLAEYNCIDADTTLRAHREQMVYLGDRLDIYNRMIHEYDLALEMSLRGIRVDQLQLLTYIKQYEPLVKQLEDEFLKVYGVNINSPKQLGELLYNKMGLPRPARSSVDEETLKDLLDKLVGLGYQTERECIQKILQYRETSKLYSTFLVGLAQLLVGDRVYPQWIPHGTDTGRWACKDPNMMNYPEHLRDIFIADPSEVIFYADYKQLELRVAATLAEDLDMLDALQHRDIHEEVRQAIAKVYPPVTRVIAKSVVFGTLYGRTARSIALQFKVPVDLATKWQESFYHKYPRLTKWFKHNIETYTTKGYLQTPFGRRKYGKRATEMLNFPVQSCAADVTIGAMFNLKDAGFKILAQIHDAVVVSCDNPDRFQEFVSCIEYPVKELHGRVFPCDPWIGKSFKKEV